MMMRAAQYDHYGDPAVIAIRQVPLPDPGKGQVRVRLAAAGVAPLDWKLRAGLLARHFTPQFPKTPGRDGAGVVEACGCGVSHLAPGDPVVVMAPPAGPAGTAAEAIVVDADLVVPVPAGLDPIAAVALANAGLSAWIAVQRTAGITAGQRVLVQSGAGAVGGLMVQLCAHLGAEVTATCRAANVDYVRDLGASRAIAYDGDAPQDLPPQDVVFDLMGGAVHAASLGLLAAEGHLVWLTAAPLPPVTPGPAQRITRALIADDAAVVAEVLALAAQGVLRAQVAGLLPLDQVAEAHRRLAAGEVTRGRLVLQI